MFSSKILNTEINNILNELETQVYADRKTLEQELIIFSNLLSKYKDKTPEEIITDLFNDVIKNVETFFLSYNFVPGINITSKVNDIIINFSIGDIDYNKKQSLDVNTMFDIASISKTPTAIIMYQLIEEKLIKISDKVNNILVECKNLPDDLKIKDLLMYRGKYLTEGRIDLASNKKEALKCVKSVLVENGDLNTYNYNDIVPILCGKIIERVSGRDLISMAKEKIIRPLNLKNIEFNNHIDFNKINSITGTPNRSKSLCNDPKANILEGYPGSAGIFSSTLDTITIFESLLKGNLFINGLDDFYTANPFKLSRGIAGQSIIPTKIEKQGYFSNLSPIISLGEDGSTRTIATSGKYVLNKENYYVNGAVFTNPCSSNPDIIKYYEKRNGKESGTYYKYFDNIGVHRIDARGILPSSSLDDILFSLQKFNLRVSLLHAYVKSYERDYDLNMTINLKYRKGV